VVLGSIVDDVTSLLASDIRSNFFLGGGGGGGKGVLVFVYVLPLVLGGRWGF